MPFPGSDEFSDKTNTTQHDKIIFLLLFPLHVTKMHFMKSIAVVAAVSQPAFALVSIPWPSTLLPLVWTSMSGSD
jgi:hypothetical protein